MIGKVIYNILSNASAVTDIVGTDIYPEIAPEGVEAPCVIFDIADVSPQYDKSGLAYDVSSVDVDMFEKDYADSVDLMVAVRAALELNTGVFNTVQVGMAEVVRIISGWDVTTKTFWWRISMQYHNV